VPGLAHENPAFRRHVLTFGGTNRHEPVGILTNSRYTFDRTATPGRPLTPRNWIWFDRAITASTAAEVFAD
jgi:hypothetical protein